MSDLLFLSDDVAVEGREIEEEEENVNLEHREIRILGERNCVWHGMFWTFGSLICYVLLIKIKMGENEKGVEPVIS